MTPNERSLLTTWRATIQGAFASAIGQALAAAFVTVAVWSATRLATRLPLIGKLEVPAWLIAGIFLTAAVTFLFTQGYYKNRFSGLRILSPLEGSKIGHQQAVSGFIWPIEDSVQVLVYSTDGKLYRQSSVRYAGAQWEVDCKFGNPPPALGIPGSPYKIIAIAGLKRIEAPVSDLPKGGRRSQIVNVSRLY